MLRNGLAKVRQNLRAILREPAFSVPVFLCLAVTIGATTAVFGVVHAVVLRPLPFASPAELRFVYATLEQSGEDKYLMSVANTLVLQQETTVFSGLSLSRAASVTLDDDVAVQQIPAAFVSPDFFETLGVVPLIGGGFQEQASTGGAVAYLSESLWRQSFGADNAIVGRRVLLDDAPVTVIGIIRSDQVFPADTQVWQAFRPGDVPQGAIHSGNFAAVGRVPATVGADRVSAELERVSLLLRERYPDNNRSRSIRQEPLHETLLGDTDTLMWLLLGIVGLLLVLGVANVVNLVTVRNRQSAAAIATHAILGASRWQVVRRLSGELLLLVVAASISGCLLAIWLAPWLLRLTGVSLPGQEVRLLAPAPMGFVIGLALVATMLTGTLPALTASRTQLLDALRGQRAAVGLSPTMRRTQSALITVQATLGILILIGAGASLLELRRLARLDPGFDSTGTIAVRLHAPENRYPTTEDHRRLFEEVLAEFRSLPGVSESGMSTTLPIVDPGARFSFSVEDRPPEDPSSVEVARGRLVSPGYFDALGIRLVRGRPVDSTDTVDAAPVVVVNESLVRSYWPGESGLGKRLKRRTYDSEFPWMTIVGVVADVREDELTTDPGPTLYMPHAQADAGNIGRSVSFVVRSDRGLEQLGEEIRGRLAQVDRSLAPGHVAAFGDLVDDSVAPQRLAGRLLGAFAALGLILLSTGVYGVVAFAATQRRSEIGLRRALGASNPGLVTLLLRANLAAVAIGCVVGTALSWAAGRAFPQLGGGPVLYVVAVSLLLAVGTVASIIPARQATRIELLAALQHGGSR